MDAERHSQHMNLKSLKDKFYICLFISPTQGHTEIFTGKNILYSTAQVNPPPPPPQKKEKKEKKKVNSSNLTICHDPFGQRINGAIPLGGCGSDVKCNDLNQGQGWETELITEHAPLP